MDEVLIRSFRADWIGSGKSSKTADQYVWALRRIAAEGIPLPPDLDLVTAREWLARRQRHVKLSTAAFEARALKVFSAFAAIEFGDDDHLARLRLPNVPNPGAQATASREDVRKLLASFDTDQTFEGIRDRAMIHVLWASGVRREELAQMRVINVNLLDAYVDLDYVKRTRRGATSRTAPLAGAVRPLNVYMHRRKTHRHADRAELWLSRSGPLTPWGVGQALQRRSAAAGVKLSPQTFRRGMATDWKANGLSDSGLIAAMGWSSPRMLMRYTAANSERLAIEEARRARNEGLS